jgi:uncharacterized membrane protein
MGRFLIRFIAINLAIAAGIFLVLSRGDLRALAAVLGDGWGPPHLPDWGRFANASTVIMIHVGTVAAAFVLGIVLLVGPKGRLPHRVLGWIWASLMVTTGVATLFIHSPRGVGATFYGFSFLHLFSVWTLVGAPLGVYLARRHRVARHRGVMTGLFFGGLVFAGIFAFLPGRLMHAVVFG